MNGGETFNPPQADYLIETNPFYDFSTLNPGDSIELTDTDFGLAATELRIIDIQSNLYGNGSTITVSPNAIKSKKQNLELKVADLDRSVKSAKLYEVNVVRANQVTTSELKNALLNPVDERIHADKIRKGTILFEAIDTPVVANYQADYAATFGNFPLPDVKLYTIDASGNVVSRSEQPYFIMTAGKIDSITFGTLSDGIQTGFIKLQ